MAKPDPKTTPIPPIGAVPTYGRCGGPATFPLSMSGGGGSGGSMVGVNGGCAGPGLSPSATQRAAVLFVAALSEDVDRCYGIDAANGTPETRDRVADVVVERFFEANLMTADPGTTANRRPKAQVPLADLPRQLRIDAEELSGCGAGNEAEHARQAADEIERLRWNLGYRAGVAADRVPPNALPGWLRGYREGVATRNMEAADAKA